MKIKNLLSIPVMLLTLALAGCNGGTGSTNSASTNSVNLSNKLTSAENNGLLITNPSSADINWTNDSLVNIPIGAKGLKAIKVTNTTNQPFNKLTLETSANKPQSITIDNDRTTCSMGLPLAANASCLYVFSYSPTGGYESGTFTATVSAEQAENNAKVSIGVDYSTRVSANAGTLSVNVDTSALNCTATSCNGTLYVVNSKGAKVSTVVNITGNNGTVFGAGLVNLDPNDSYTIEASPINGSVPTYLPGQKVTLVADATTTVTVKYPAAPVSSGKAIITLPNVVPTYTGTLNMQVLNTINHQVVDSEDLKQGDKAVVDLPVSDATHSYVVKLANGIADPVSGLFYDQESETPLELKESGITNLSIPMAKATSLSNVTLAISGLQYESKTSSEADTATVSFSDADNHYKYVNQYNQSNSSKYYKVKNGLNFTIQTQANGTNSYKVNPIVNNFTVDGTKSVNASFKAGANVVGRVVISLVKRQSAYTDSLPIQLLNIKNGNQIVKEFNLKQGESIIFDNLPVDDESHEYVGKILYGVADPINMGAEFQYQCSPQTIPVINSPTEAKLGFNCIIPTDATKFTISGLKGSDKANVMFSGDGRYVKWKYVNDYNQTNGEKTYFFPRGQILFNGSYAPAADSYTITTQAVGSGHYVVNPIVTSEPYNLVSRGGEANFTLQPLMYIGTQQSTYVMSKIAFTHSLYPTAYIKNMNNSNIYSYPVYSDGTLGGYSLAITSSGIGGVAFSQNDLYAFSGTDHYLSAYTVLSNGTFKYQDHSSREHDQYEVATTPNGEYVFSTASDNDINSFVVTHTSNGSPVITYKSAVHSGRVNSISVNNSGTKLYALTSAGYLNVYGIGGNAALTLERQTYLGYGNSYYTAGDLSPDNKYFYVVAPYTGTSHVMDMYSISGTGVPTLSYRYIIPFDFAQNTFRALTAAPNGKYLYLTSHDNQQPSFISRFEVNY